MPVDTEQFLIPLQFFFFFLFVYMVNMKPDNITPALYIQRTEESGMASSEI